MTEFVRSAFKAYDIRGRVPDELNTELAYRIGRAFACQLRPQRVVVGQDVRLSSRELAEAVMKGLTDSGCDVWDIGLCGTEQVYFSTFYWQADGGIMVTASHNPMDYNGMKLVREQSRPISGDSGLRLIEDMAVTGQFAQEVADCPGQVHRQDSMPDYIRHLLSYVEIPALKPLSIVVNPGNGCAGPVLKELEKKLPFRMYFIHQEPDGTFPHGIPNPLLPECRADTIAAVQQVQADMGIAWDGDFDRCFLFDGKGNFIEGYYIVGLLAQAFLAKVPGSKIIHDPRLTWNTIEQVKAFGGIPVQSKTGHAFIKERMRAEDAIYGGEMSAHHYFREFSYCDSGMIPWLLVAEVMSRTGKTLEALVRERMLAFPCSGEINRKVESQAAAKRILAAIEETYARAGAVLDRTDGLSIAYENWRFNLRLSNTEPVIRLNVESWGDRHLMEKKKLELLAMIEREGK